MPGASRSGEEQPTLGVTGVFNGGLVGLSEPLLGLRIGGASAGVQGVEPEPGQCAQVAVTLKPFQPLSFSNLFLAGTEDSTTKVGMADGNVLSYPAFASANGTIVRGGLLLSAPGNRIVGDILCGHLV